MNQRVFVVLVARNGEKFLPRTIEGIKQNARAITEIVTVDVSSTDGTAALLSTLEPRHALSVNANATFAESIAVALYALSSAGTRDDDLIWILHDDSSPLPGALDNLTTAFEMGPSVAIAGPKVVSPDNPSRLTEFGLTLTRAGRLVAIGQGQLDQSQFDDVSDVLGVGTPGMLVRRSTLVDLAGFDSSLSFGDDGLDLCVRARLTGTRVIRVPGARVAHPLATERPGSHVRRGYGAKREEQWYRQIVYANPLVGFVRWITVVIAAIVFSAGHLIAKHPGRVPGEFAAAIVTLVSPRKLLRGRKRFRRTRTMPMSSIEPLFQRPAETRAGRAANREREVAQRLAGVDLSGAPEFRYWESRAPWIVAFAVAVAVVLWLPLLSASALTGGGVAPLSDLPQLWNNALRTSVDLVSGVSSPPDPFTAVLAVIGSVAGWAPSVGVVAVFVLAIPFAAFGGGVATGRILGSGRAAVIGSIGWMLAPPFLSALAAGRLGAIIAHLCIPFVAYFMTVAFDRRRTTAQSVTAFSAAGLVAAVAVSAAPSILIGLVPAWIIVMAVRPRSAVVTVWTIVPSLVVIFPTAVSAILAGSPLRVFADPGIPVAFDVPSRLTVLAGLPQTDALGLRDLAESFGIPGVVGLAVPVLVALLAAAAALVTRRWLTAAVGIVCYLACALAAVVLSPVTLMSANGEGVPIWTGSLLSVGYLGLVVAASGAGSSERWQGSLISSVAVLALVAVSVPWGMSIVAGKGLVQASNGSVFPAIVEVSRSGDPDLRVLTVTRLGDGRLSARLELASAGRLDSANTVANATQNVTPGHEQLASVAAALVTPGADDAAAAGLDTLGVRYVVYQTQDSEAGESDIKVLEVNPAIDKVATTDFGELWAVSDATSIQTPSARTDWFVMGVRGAILLLFVLLAIPTSRPARQLSRTDELDPLPEIGGDDDE